MDQDKNRPKNSVVEEKEVVEGEEGVSWNGKHTLYRHYGEH